MIRFGAGAVLLVAALFGTLHDPAVGEAVPADVAMSLKGGTSCGLKNNGALRCCWGSIGWDLSGSCDRGNLGNVCGWGCSEYGVPCDPSCNCSGSP